MMRKVETQLNGASLCDPQVPIAPFVMETDETGAVVVRHATFMFFGECGEAHRVGNRIAITIGTAGCKCGCKATGVAMMFTPEIEHARALAASLTQLCDTMEAGARLAANAALRKAAAK